MKDNFPANSVKLYLAGPMRGYDDFNFPAFHRAADKLRERGYEIVSPAEMDEEMGFDPTCTAEESVAIIESGAFDFHDAMQRDIAAILECDGIALLPGWEKSTGARAEKFVAETTGKDVWFYMGLGILTAEPEDAAVGTLEEVPTSDGVMRSFETGATRNAADHKHDYEGFLSPLVIREYGAYMHGNRVQADGSLRASDNWQKGIPLDVYMKSAWRHFMDLWTIHRGYNATDFDGQDVDAHSSLGGLLFNLMGYWHECLVVDFEADDVHRPEPEEMAKAREFAAAVNHGESHLSVPWRELREAAAEAAALARVDL